MNIKLKSIRYLVLILCCYSNMAIAQQVSVSGKVRDIDDNTTIPGVAVKVKGTNNATLTDNDGKFTIKVNATATLVFSAIGMKTKEVILKDETELNILLSKDVQTLNGVVVVGYGVQKKSLVTGAISSISTKDLEVPGIMRADQALQGKTPGVTVMMNSGQPGSGVSIRIRGVGTNGSNDPLFIVDGFPRGDLEAVNPRDIETMEVLKDAASAAIYGARGANGVIIITTKSGKAGKSKLDYEYYRGFQNIRKYIDVLDATQYARIQNELHFNSNLALPFSETEINKMGTGTDWQREISYRNAPIQNHQVSISGGSTKNTYSSSFSYFSQSGTLAKGKSDFDRYTGRINTKQNVIEGVLNTGVNLNVTNVKRASIATNSGNSGPILSAINMDPVTPVMNDDGTFAISRYVSQEIVNPIARIYYTNGSSGYTRLNADVFGEVQIISDLKFKSSLGLALQYNESRGYTPIYYLNSTNRTVATGTSKSMSESRDLNLENTLTYSKKINIHSFSAMLGNTLNTGKGTNVSASKNGLLYDDPNYAYLDLAKDNTSAAASGGAWHSGLVSYFGRINYDFNNKYMMTATFRADGSFRFGKNNKFGYFPSVSAGWNVHNEKFLENVRFVNSLKVRASWGRTGNDQIGDYAFVSTISTYARNYYFGNDVQQIGASPAGVSNPDLKWETSEQANIGVDAELFKNFKVTLDLYRKATKDLLLRVPIPYYVGNGAPFGNAGNVLNRGIELSLGYQKDFGKLYIEANINGAYNNNKVTYVGNTNGYITGGNAGNQMGDIARMEAGLPLGYFWMYTMDGIFQNQSQINAYRGPSGNLVQPNAVPGDIKYKDLNGDGIIDSRDRSMVGTPHPKFNYGFNFTARYGNLDFNVFFNGLAGNQIFNSLHRWDLPTANFPVEIINRWHGEGTTNSFPRIAAGDLNGNFANASTFFLENGSYLRLRNASIGYTFRNLKVAKLDRIRAYITGNNLFVLTKYTGFDPEVSGGALGLGIDRGVYPQPRTIMIGANVGF
ncbi:SusC/RagA family TonB-linked outer membrane protein [Pedobacter sp.]